MKKIPYLLFLLVIGSACINKKTEDIFEMSFVNLNSKKLFSEKIPIYSGEKHFNYLFSMNYKDSLLFIGDKSAKHCMKIFDLEKNKLRNFSEIGKGVHEITAPVAEVSVDYKNNELYVGDDFKCYVYAIDKLRKEQDIPERTISLKYENDFRFMYYTFAANGYIVGSSIESPCAVLNLNTRVLRTKSKYKTNSRIEQGKTYSHPILNKVVREQIRSGVLEFVSYGEAKIEFTKKTWWEYDGGEQLKKHKEYRKPFIDISVGEHFIYGLYSGQIYKGNDVLGFSKSNKIFVLDWEGNPIKKYLLDTDVRCIALDGKNNILYAGAEDEEGELSIVKFNLL